MNKEYLDTMILEIDITKCNKPIREVLDLINILLNKNNMEIKSMRFDKESD